jgi:N-acetylneuraminic acid mutarotase
MARLSSTAIVCAMGIGFPMSSLVSSSNEPYEKTAARTLTFTERVSYQEAIEEVYWRHRIWPKENPEPKPSLDAIISEHQIEQKVEDYMRKSELVTTRRGLPISASELQVEMDRIAQHTKRPEMLREFFAALGNDPFVIAECLARPMLAERLAAAPGVVTPISPAPTNLSDTAASTGNRICTAANSYNAQYKLPEIALLDCAGDDWTAISTTDAPDGRIDYTAVWTGSEMIVWGGFNGSPPYFLNTGGRYDPTTDSWTATDTSNAPSARDFHAAVWTGSEMIVWGGYNNGNDLNSGGRYNPAADTWDVTNATDAPIARESHTAVWTGIEMIVWGGLGCGSNCRLNSGGRYNPNTNAWTPTSTINAPEARWYHTAHWIGDEMIVWGGTNQTIYLNTGGRYNPSADSWAPIGLANVPLGRIAHTGVWTGSEMIVWGGVDSTFNDTNTGGTYNPSEDSWMAISTVNAPSARDSHTAVWNGSQMIVWAGVFCCPAIDFDTGGRYDAATDSWTATSTANAPLARWAHKAVWTGGEMLVWGGYNDPSNLFLNTGGRYCARPEATPTPTATPTGTATPTATPTPGATPTPRIAPTPRTRPTPRPRP